MARERIALECGRKNIGLSRITREEKNGLSKKKKSVQPMGRAGKYATNGKPGKS